MEAFFHVYNRTIAKEIAFSNFLYQRRFLASTNYYRFPQSLKYSAFRDLSPDAKMDHMQNLISPLVKIIAFTVMPNHYHFLVKTDSYKKVSEFISKIQNSYAKYYNLVRKRDGSLFQHQYKWRQVESNEDLISLSKYIHLNPIKARLIAIDKLPYYYSSSLRFYVRGSNNFIETDIILGIFGSFQRYWMYLHPKGGGRL